MTTKAECIDMAAGLELWQDEGGCFIKLEDDPKASCSLLFAYHESGVEGSDGEWVSFDSLQEMYVEEWFEEYHG